MSFIYQDNFTDHGLDRLDSLASSSLAPYSFEDINIEKGVAGPSVIFETNRLGDKFHKGKVRVHGDHSHPTYIYINELLF